MCYKYVTCVINERIKKTEKMSIGRAQTTSHKKKKSMSESQL